VAVELASGFSRPEEVRQLFREYTDLVMAEEPDFREYLAMQDFDHECQHLAEKYGPPGGRLYLAWEEGRAAGCVGLKALDSERCEMKRLYVRPAFRGRRIGTLLARQVIRDAEEAGYRAMLLDTFPSLREALALYQKLGFYEIPRYSDSPIAGTVYLQLDLSK